MNSNDITDEHLFCLVAKLDKQLFDEGMDIKQRYWNVPKALMEEFGFVSYTMFGGGAPKIFDRINEIFRSIYRPQDLAGGGHICVFMYHDIFARISIPHIYGQVIIEPFKHVELTPAQLRIIQTEPDQTDMYIDQFADVFDIQFGINEIKKEYSQNNSALNFINLSKLQLHASAAILTGGYDFRGAVQCSILAAELALKASLAANGLNENEIKNKFGHDLKKILNQLKLFWPGLDHQRVLAVLQKMPDYVENRYTQEQPDRVKVGHIAMSAQYIVSEVVRQLSDRRFRTDNCKRYYPSCTAE